MLQFHCNSTPLATFVVVLEACSELRASGTICNENSCKAISLWVLAMGTAADCMLVCNPMTVCGGSALEVDSEVWQLPLQLSQLQQ